MVTLILLTVIVSIFNLLVLYSRKKVLESNTIKEFNERERFFYIMLCFFVVSLIIFILESIRYINNGI
jgi:cell division protein FtsW (lipid II flippase)